MNDLCFILLCICFSFSKLSYAADTLSSSQNITDGTSLVSPGGVFELGFFTPGISESRYFGIWYKNIPVKTVVWVANRGTLINDSSGHLMINTPINDSSGRLEQYGVVGIERMKKRKGSYDISKVRVVLLLSSTAENPISIEISEQEHCWKR